MYITSPIKICLKVKASNTLVNPDRFYKIRQPRKIIALIKIVLPIFRTSDYRSSNVGPSDSEKDCPPSRRDSESIGPNNLPASRLVVTGTNDSESGGSHSPSPRASRRRQVLQIHVT